MRLMRAGVVVAAATGVSLAQVQIEGATAPGLPFAEQIVHQDMMQLASGERITVQGVRTPDGELDLVLERKDVLLPGAEIVVGTLSGQRTLEMPRVVNLAGHVVGEPDKLAYLSVSAGGVQGFVERTGTVLSISTGPNRAGATIADALRIARVDDIIDPALDSPACGYAPAADALNPAGPMVETGPADPFGERGAGCQLAAIAIDSDYEFTNRLFGGNAGDAAAYLVSLMGAISEIYERDTGTRLAVPFLRVWADNVDPYSTSGPDALDQVRNHWTSEMGHVTRTLTHYFSGRTNLPYGGVAYLSTLCNESFGYGVSGYLNGFFPYPLVAHSGSNWDLVVAAHELGHNFGTGHTHDAYNPVIDGCGNGNCGSPFGGTIMSYCHTCSGGINNIDLRFHPRVIDVITGTISSVNGFCPLEDAGIVANDDNAITFPGVPVEIDPLLNDSEISCDPVGFSLATVDSSSALGGVVELLAGQGPNGRDLFRYTPPAGADGVDTFSYSLSGGAAATVSITIDALRIPAVPVNPEPGLKVSYYDLPDPSFVPNFDFFDAYAEDIVSTVNFASTGGDFSTSERSDNFGALYEGYFSAPFDGVYTFSTNSDDGSKLYIGNEVVVDNDGLHGMLRVSGQIPLEAGPHELRIEFFERGGGAGLIVEVEGPNLSGSVLPAVFLSHEEPVVKPCNPADSAQPFGVLDFSDVINYLGAFSGGGDYADFAEPFGVLDFTDVVAFLTTFAAGCP